VNVPGGALSGPLMLTGPGGDSPASVAVFTLMPPLPALTSLDPNSGPQALEVKIRGARFTGATGLSFLDSGRVLAALDVVNDGEIRFKWPLGEPSGRVAVIMGGETSAGLPFAVTAAYAPGVMNIVDFNPKRGEAGDEITIGEGAFAGMHAFVLRLMPARKRVQVLINILGGSTPVEVDRSSVVLNKNTLADMVPVLAAAH